MHWLNGLKSYHQELIGNREMYLSCGAPRSKRKQLQVHPHCRLLIGQLFGRPQWVGYPHCARVECQCIRKFHLYALFR